MLNFLRKLKKKTQPLRINYQNSKNVKALWHFEFTIDSEVGENSKLILYKEGKIFFKVDSFTLLHTNFLAINTHFLTNGNHEFEVMLQVASKKFQNTFQLNINNDSELAHKLAAHMKRMECEAAFLNEVNSTYFPPTEDDLLPWFNKKNYDTAFNDILNKYNPTSNEQKALAEFSQNGFTIIRSGIDRNLIDACKTELEDAAENQYQGYKDGTSQRLEHLHNKYPNIRKLWLDKTVIRYLTMIFDSKPLPCQTLGYVYGSQQDLHQDTIHLTPFPAGYMCGVWIPLEDVRPNSGELLVVPKSHKLQRILRKDVGCATVRNGDWSEFIQKVVPIYPQLIAEANLNSEPYIAKAGDILIWHENLIHGGSQRKDLSISRKSIVSHYFADGSLAYYDSTGLPGHMATQE